MFTLVSLIILFLILPVGAQECGPSCPVCSGTGSTTGALISQKHFVINSLFIPSGEEETGVVNVRSGIASWMDAGVGYTIKTAKPIWSIRIQPLKDDEESWKPGMLIGTGSIRTGGSDQSLFIQVIKSWEISEDFAFQLNGGIASLMPGFDQFYILAGFTTAIKEKWSVFSSYDGTNYHFGLSWIPTERLLISTLLVEAKDPAISLGYRWKPGD
jgi:hypothetical protein